MTVPFRGSMSELSPQKLRSRRYQRLTRDVYLLGSGEVSLRDRVMAARVVMPDAVACLQTAGVLLGLPVPDDGLVHLARSPSSHRTERPGVRVHRIELRVDEVQEIAGVPCTGGPRTLADLAARLTDEELVVAGDVVLRRWGADAVERAVNRMGGRRGARRLRTVVPLLDAGADSPPESRGRLRLHAAGFTRMQHGVVVRDEHGGWLCAPDLADELARVAWQHDGAVHFDKGVQQWRKDLARDESARQRHWQVIQSTALDDVRPWLLVAKIEAAYERAAVLWGADVLPGHLRPRAQW